MWDVLVRNTRTTGCGPRRQTRVLLPRTAAEWQSYNQCIMRSSPNLLLVLALGVAQAQESNRPPDAMALSAIPPAAVDSLRFDRDLPNIDIHDIQGRVWRPEDFRGKFTLVYVWHTFEARAVDAHSGRGHDQLLREEGLPDLREVQRFCDRAKATGKLQVLTLCCDYDYTHAPEYMREAGFSFPVVADWKVIDKLLGTDVRYSRYSVISPDGKLSAPFQSWTLGRVLFELEAIAAK
jgi:hypothetical protein